MRDTKRGRDIGRGRSRLPVGSLMQDSIPGPWDHDLSQRLTFNSLSHPGTLNCNVLNGNPAHFSNPVISWSLGM